MKLKISRKIFVLLAALALAANIFGHGGEDHGATQAKTQTTDSGTVSRSARLGEVEIMLKHPLLIPDQTANGRLFLTKFESNEPFPQAKTEMEIEAANGLVTALSVEKSAQEGVFSIKFPALAEGKYAIRAKITHGGETDTATFSDVEIKNQPAAATESGMSWTRTLLIGFIFSVVLALFGVLFYFVLRVDSAEKTVRKETVSA